MIREFFQNIGDLGDIGDELEAGQRVSTAYYLTQLLKQLDEAGFYVFGAREIQLLEGGVSDEPSLWPVAIVHVLRKDNNKIRVHL